MSTNIDVKHMDKIWALESVVEQQQTDITSAKNVIYALQKDLSTAREAVRVVEARAKAQISDLKSEVESLNHRFSVMFADMTEMKRSLAPMREEKERQEAIAKAKAEIEAAEKTIESARKVIASGGVEEGYW